MRDGSGGSSYSGTIDLAGFKKDRFYLYQSHWRRDVVYESGELKVVACRNGIQRATDTLRTADAPAAVATRRPQALSEAVETDRR